MTPELWKKVSHHLDELLPLDPSSQKEKLARVRLAEPDVAAEVESLLRQQDTMRNGGLEIAVDAAWQAVESAPDEPPALPDLQGDGLRYLPVRFHARGGLGEVFVAQDKEVGREVALKLIQARHAAFQDSRTRFLREAEITGRLEHPGIVPIYGIGQDEAGQPFYAMRFIRGDSLRDAIAAHHAAGAEERQRGLRDLLSRFVAVCNAVAYAHSRGIIHRDIKPANVMLGGFGETLVVDWGLARPFQRTAEEHAGGEETLQPSTMTGESGTLQGKTIGTPAFMSPEQANGLWHQVGPASDIFSLGATLYYLLTGKPPYTGEDILDQARAGRFSRPRDVDRAIPPALEAICLKALAREPGQRYGSAKDLAADVERWLRDEPVGAWREPWQERTRRWLKRHRTLVTSTVAALLVATGVLAVAAALLTKANEDERRARSAVETSEIAAQSARTKAQDSEKDALRKGEEAERQARRAETERQRAERGEQDIRRKFYASQIRLGEQLWDRGEVLNLQRLLQTLLPEPKQEDLRGFEWYYLRQLAFGQGDFTLAGHGAPVNALAVSPDGTLLAAAVGNVGAGLLAREPSKPGEVKVWDLHTRRVRFSLRGHSGPVTAVAFAPDGNALATGSTDKTVRLWDTTGRQTALLTEHTAAVSSVVYSPDGKWLATAAIAPHVFLREAATGKITRSAELGGASSLEQATWSHAAFAPDSRSLAVTNASQSVSFWDVASGHSHRVRVSDTLVTALAFSPDGNTLAVNGNTPKVNLIDLRTREVRASLVGHSRGVTSLAFSPEGGTLATGSYDGTVRLWDVRTAQEQAALKGLLSTVNSVVFSPSDARLLIGGMDGNVTGWDISRQPGKTIAQGDGRVVRSLAFLPRSEEVAVASGERYAAIPPGEVRVWHAGGGMPARIFQGTHRTVTGVALAPDSRALAVSFGHAERLQAGGELWLCEVGGANKTVLQESAGAITACAYSPDGKLLAVAVVSGNPFTGASRTRVKFLGVPGTNEQKPPLLVSGMVSSLAFSPDGRQLLTGTSNLRDPDSPAAVQIWQVGTGAFQQLAGQFGEVPGVALSPDGTLIATGETQLAPQKGFKCIVRLWSAASGKLLRTLDESRGIAHNVAFSPDGKSVAVAAGSAVRVVSAEGGVLRFTVDDPLATCAVFSPDGKRLATARIDGDLNKYLATGSIDAEDVRPGAVRLWDAENGAAVATFEGYAGFPSQLVFSADGKTLASRGEDGSVALWDVALARQQRLVLGQDLQAEQAHLQPVISLVVAPDGKTLYTGGRDKLIKVWDVASGRVRATLSGHTEPVTVLAISPDGKILASGSGGDDARVGRHPKPQPGGTPAKREPGEMILWDTVRLKELKTVPMNPGWVGGLAFPADGTTLAVGIGSVVQRTTVRFWNPATLSEQTERAVTFPDPDQVAGGVDAMAYDRDGARLAVAFSTVNKSGVGVMHVAILDRATGKRLTTLKGHTNPIVAVAFSPDGKTVATSSTDNLVKLWQASSGEELLTLRGHANWVNGLAFSPSGTVLATGARSGQGHHGELFFWSAPVTLAKRVVYFDDPTTGFARLVERLDDKNHLVEICCFDKDSQPFAPPLLGFARKVFSYDRDELADVSYFDANGKLLLPRVVVTFVAEDGQCKRLGIKPGDALQTFDSQPIRSMAHFVHSRRMAGAGDLVFERQGVSHMVHLEAGLIGCQLRDEPAARARAQR